ncbi:MAG: glycosyltransferase [Anaerolineae bacterium]
MTWDSNLHLCWFIEPWAESREKYLLAWQKLGWHCVLWHSGQIEQPPVPGVELRLVDDLITGSDIEEVFKYERHYGSHASCADIFRYFVLYQLGGAYVDIDVLPDLEGEILPGATCDWPLFGMMGGAPTLALEIRFIRSTPGHELLCRLIEQAVKNEKRYMAKGGYRSLRFESIIARTGPGMAHEVVLKYVKETTKPLEAFLVRATIDHTAENRSPGYGMGLVRAMRVVTKRKSYGRSFVTFIWAKRKPRQVKPDGVVAHSQE